jgi:hypothetical protein
MIVFSLLWCEWLIKIKILIITLVFTKKRHFFADSWQISQTIMIITSTSCPVKHFFWSELDASSILQLVPGLLVLINIQSNIFSPEEARLLNFIINQIVIVRWTRQRSNETTGKQQVIGTGLPDGLFSNPNSQFWVNFEWSCNRRCWYILWPFGKFYAHFVCFVDIRYILF